MKVFANHIMLVLAIGGLALVACHKESTPNRPPSITALNVPAEVNASVDVTVSCVATDPDSDALAYNWSCTAGDFQSTTGSAVVWTAPESSGTATFTVIVQDDSGAADTASATITINPVTNTIIDWTDSVAAGDVQQFTSSYLIAGYTLHGSFSAEPNGISFFVLDSANYQLWRNFQSFDALFRADSSKGSDYSVVIPTTGSYNFVLDNTYNPLPDSAVHLLAQTTSP